MDFNQVWQSVQSLNDSKKTLEFLKIVLSNISVESTDLVLEIFKFITQQIISLYEKSRIKLAERIIDSIKIIAETYTYKVVKLSLCEFYNALGAYFRQQSELQLAQMYLNEGLELGNQSNQAELVYCHLSLNLCGVFSDMQNNQEALKHAKNAVAYSQEVSLNAHKNSKNIEDIIEAVFTSYYTVGLQEETLNHLDNAFEWYSKAYKFATKNLNDKKQEVINRLNETLNLVSERIKLKKTRPQTTKNLKIANSESSRNNISRGGSGNRIKVFEAKNIPSLTGKNYNLKDSNTARPPLKISQSKETFYTKRKNNFTVKPYRKLREPGSGSDFDKLGPMSNDLKPDKEFPKPDKKSKFGYALKSDTLQKNIFDKLKHIEIINSLKTPNEIPDPPEKNNFDKAEDINALSIPKSYEKIFKPYNSVNSNEPGHLETPTSLQSNIESKPGPKLEISKNLSIKVTAKRPNQINLNTDGLNSSVGIQTANIEDDMFPLNDFSEIRNLGKYSYKALTDQEIESKTSSRPFSPTMSEFYPLSTQKTLARLYEIDMPQKEYEMRYYINDIINGMHILGSNEYLVSIQQSQPGSDFSVNFDFHGFCISKKAQYLDFMHQLNQNFIQKQWIFCSFFCDGDQITIKIPVKIPFQLIYYQQHILSNQCSYFIQVSEVEYNNYKSYLVEAISNNSPKLDPLLVDSKYICSILDITLEQVLNSIQKLISLILLKDSQIYIEKSRKTEEKLEEIKKNGEKSEEKNYLIKKPQEESVEKNNLIKKTHEKLEEKNTSIEKAQEKLEEKNTLIEKTQEKLEEKNTDIEKIQEKLEKQEKIDPIGQKKLEIVATKLQSTYRGYLVRKNLHKDIVSLTQKEMQGRIYKIKIIDSPSTKSLKVSISSSGLDVCRLFNYPVPFKAPFEKSIPDSIKFEQEKLCIESLSAKKIYYFDAQYSDKPLEDYNASSDPDAVPRLYDRIIFRSCISKNDKIYQITMNLSKSPQNEDNLVFTIRHGSAIENTQKFTIDVKTICEKTGLDERHLALLGSHVVNHMLVLGNSDISYIDFTKKNIDPIRKLIRVQAIIRGILSRKNAKYMVKKPIHKRKLLINGEKWTCLIYFHRKDLVLKMVKGIEVLAVQINSIFLPHEANLSDYENFVKKVLLPNIKIISDSGKLKIAGLDKFLVRGKLDSRYASFDTN